MHLCRSEYVKYSLVSQDAFLLENYLSSVRGKFQETIFVSFKAFFRSYMYILQEKITPKGAKIVLETDMSSALFGYTRNHD